MCALGRDRCLTEENKMLLIDKGLKGYLAVRKRKKKMPKALQPVAGRGLLHKQDSAGTLWYS